MTPAAKERSPRDLKSFKYFDLLLSIFIVILLISNLVAQKLCSFGTVHIGPWTFSIIVSGAQLLFPLTYIFGDIFTEVYGYAASRRAIWLGFFASALMALLGLVIVALPPAPAWKNQEAFATVFGFIPRLVVASLIAYWAGEFANSFTMAKMKILTRGRFLWTRTVGSTVIGQAVDTLLIMVIAFAGTVDAPTIVDVIVSGYLAKVIYEIAMTPLTYLVVGFLKRHEGVDIYDYGTEFSPFHISG